jgi:hypothetical protein
MNETPAAAADATQYTEFVWRRLEDPLKIFGYELPWQIWLVILGVVLATALFYVVWMYIKDSRGVGPIWAIPMGLLRCTVYAILAVVFLLPSRQSFVETRTEAKFLVGFDISGSMHTSDQLPTGRSNEKLTTRMEYVREFLSDPKVKFFAALEKKNPGTVYRFGTRLDEFGLHMKDGYRWTHKEKEKPARDDGGALILPPRREFAPEFWEAWLNPVAKVQRGGDDDGRLKELEELNKKILKEGLPRGTNLGDSLLALLNKELNNRVQGIIVFSDGRSTEGSARAFRELEQRARAAHVPIFVVGIGEDRLRVKIEIVDVRVPPQIQPEDKFRSVIELVGVGLAGKPIEFGFELIHVKKDKKTKKEELLPIKVIEAEDKDNPKAKRIEIDLGKKLVLKPPVDVKFDNATPPRARVEYQLDALALAAAAGKDLEKEYAGKKWEIKQTGDDSEFKFRARVPVDKREGLIDRKTGKPQKDHESNLVAMKVLKRPVRVLLFASAATRDYQFLRTLMVREVEKDRIKMAIHLQLPPGETKYRRGVVQDVPPERLLTAFPDTFGTKKTSLSDLSSFDVIVCFDPDWKRLTPEQIRLLARWCKQGGGLIYLGGHFNTVKMVFADDEDEPGKYRPLLDLLPIVLGDRRDYLTRKTDTPWGLDLEGASPEFEFLRLDEDLDESKYQDAWKQFFFGEGKDATTVPQRGFYNFYPVKKVKTGSLVVARLTDPSIKIMEGREQKLHPFIVLTPDTLERVVWIGSTETWRLREYKESYHERFWTKLLRYAGAKSNTEVRNLVRVEVGDTHVTGKPVVVEAKIDTPGGKAWDVKSDSRRKLPEIKIKLPPGLDDKEIMPRYRSAEDKPGLKMASRVGAQEGWFTGQFIAKAPGEYVVTVRVYDPDDKAGKVVLASDSKKIVIKESNPEMDDTRPDFDRLYRLASEADEVLLRMTEADRNELKRRLARPKPSSDSAPREKDTFKDDKLRLYFDLRNAGMIPKCMVQDVQKQTARGPVNDLWDDGWTIHEYPPSSDPTKQRKPIKISYVLMAVVGLLSLEWLMRKLLRLA